VTRRALPKGPITRIKLLAEYSALIVWTLGAILIVLLARGSVYAVAVSTFGAVIAASLLIAWAAEASESSISRGLALAIVAIVQTIPEYFVEGTIAWKAGKDTAQWLPNVIANFTGANRLLTGFGWPLILFTLVIQRRRKGESGPNVITLRKEQSIEQVFMLGSSLYYVWILIEGSLTLLDSIVLAGTFVVYMWMLARLPRRRSEPEEALEGPSKELAEIKSKRRKLAAIIGLFLFGGLTFILITDSFVVSIQYLAQTFLEGLLGTGAVFFTIQWISPVLSEFPEKVTAFNWARQITLAPVALLNFISSAVNELTALVALIPIVFVVSSDRLGSVPLDHQQWIEIFLTMSQSLYACAALLDLSYDSQNAVVLFVLWIVSTAVIEARLAVGVLFLVFAFYEILRKRRRIIAFGAFRQTLNEGVLHRDASQS
jgi:cation:H+ antiporter